MELFVQYLFFFLAVCAAVSKALSRKDTVQVAFDTNFKGFQRNYLAVYLMAMAADWLQGPYMYALYQEYGFDRHAISGLFVAGFGSSLLFGTCFASLTDRWGRKKGVLLYGVTYMISCLTKHSPNYWVLMFGRLMGGIATSLLYSAFESWMVFQHIKHGFDKAWLSDTFSRAVLGNSIVAIISGVVADLAAERFGKVVPFDIACAVLLAMTLVVLFTWEENYGNESADLVTTFKNGIAAVRDDRRTLYLGTIQAMFEGTMYMFVLMWTPALQMATGRSELPFGWIFATFMIAVMVGSDLFVRLLKVMPIESSMRCIFLTAAAALAPPVVVPGAANVVMVGFVLFEAMVGCFWPAMGTLRSRCVPESVRSTVLSLFRMPLNLIVIGMLLTEHSIAAIFQFGVIFLLLCAALQHLLYRAMSGDRASHEVVQMDVL